MIGMKIVTPQTSDEGKIVRRVYLEKGYEIKNELYLCITVDRDTGGNTIIYSKKGGVNIEEISETNPEEIYNMKISPGSDLLTHHARTIVYNLGLTGAVAKKAQKNILGIYKAFVSLDAAMIEINPFAITKDELKEEYYLFTDIPEDGGYFINGTNGYLYSDKEKLLLKHINKTKILWKRSNDPLM